jgi:hypothetical protein
MNKKLVNTLSLSEKNKGWKEAKDYPRFRKGLVNTLVAIRREKEMRMWSE